MKKITTLFILLFSIIASAQDFRFGKVSKEEILEKEHNLESDVDAAILYKEEKINFEYSNADGFTQNRRVFERIKIYTKEGYSYANHSVKTYNKNSSSREKVSNLKGYTYNLDSKGNIQKTKLKNESIFKDELNKYWAKTSFTMPDVKEYSVIEYEYIIKTPFMSIDDIYLQNDIPVNKLNIFIATPEYFNYNKVVNLKSKVQPSITEDKRVRRELIGQNQITFDENILKIEMDNISSLEDEPFIDNIDNYRGKIALEYAYYRAPNGKVTNYSTNWTEVTKNIYESENFGDQLKKDNFYQEDLSRITQGISEQNQIIDAVFNHVKEKIKWNDFIGYSTDKGIKSAYQNGVGNVAEINLTLVAMLRSLGIKANPVLISTRDNGVPLFPTRNGFNYVICAVEDSDKLIFLDATQKNAKPNILPFNAINWLGRIIREDNTSDWVELSPKFISKTITSVNYNFEDDLNLLGMLRERVTDYNAFSYRNKNGDKPQEDIIQKLESDNPGLTVLEYTQKSLNENNKPVTYSYEFNYDGAVEQIGDKVYVSPLTFLIDEENPFTQENRSYPIDFLVPFSDKYIVTFNLPDGYIAESLPESASVKFNNNGAGFTYIIKQQGNKINLMIDFNINQTLILPQDYPDFKQFYQFVKDKEAEKIVLVKS